MSRDSNSECSPRACTPLRSVALKTGGENQVNILQQVILDQQDVSNIRRDAPVRQPLGQARRNHWGMLRGVVYTFREYCRHSSLHGLKYITDDRRRPMDKIFWSIAFVAGLSLSAFFIIAIWSKWEQNPIIVSLDTTAAIIDDIPFPGVTICNMNKMKRSKLEQLTKSLGYFASIRSGSEESNNMNRQLMKGMSDILQWRSKSNNLYSDSEYFSTSQPDIPFSSSFTERFNITSHQELTGQNMAVFMREVTPSCRDILKYCRWDSVVSKCDQLFQEVTTDDGICCAFNSLSDALIRRPRSNASGQAATEEFWTPENGYPANRQTFPRKGAAPGISAGLTLLLDVQLSEYFLPRSGSLGFKVLLHSPSEVPAIKEFGFAISPGAESYVSVRPSVVYSTLQIRSLAQSRRKCYFQEERPLSFYRYYSVSSCIAECLANATLHKCGCKEYFMPGMESAEADNDSVKICSFHDTMTCVKDLGDVISGTRNRKLCDCQPACTELSYSHELSVSQFPTTDVGANTLENLKAAINYNNSLEYFVKNHALLHIFLRDYKVMRYKRASMYDLLDFMANMGGLLSLCLGFSFLSAAEIFYFIFMRCSFYRRMF